VDSAELSMMFRSAYSTEFYRSLRNALHFEVTQGHLSADSRAPEQLRRLWEEVYTLEAVCRTSQPTSLPIYPQQTIQFPRDYEPADVAVAEVRCTVETEVNR
jgi:hypothetical protein